MITYTKMNVEYITSKHADAIYETIVNRNHMIPIEILIRYDDILTILRELYVLIPELENIVSTYLLDCITLTYNIINKRCQFELDIIIHGSVNFESLTVHYTTVSQLYKNRYRFRSIKSTKFNFISDTKELSINDHLNFLDYYFHSTYDVRFYVNSSRNMYSKPHYKKINDMLYTVDYIKENTIRYIINKQHLELTGHIIHQFNDVIKDISNIKCKL